MDMVNKLSRNAQVVLGAAVLYLIFSFFHWQSYSTPFGSIGWSEWHGFGVVAGIVALALVAWEVSRVMNLKLPTGELSPGLVSLALAELLLVLTIIVFLTHDQARAWPAWVGLLLAIVLGVFAYLRSKDEGVEIAMPAGGSSSGGTSV